jgi:acyl carrier protein
MEMFVVLRDFLVKNRLAKIDQLDDEERSLLESGIIDSLAIFELTEFIEKTYEIQVDADDLIPENFDSLKAIRSYIDKKSNSKE